jgi:hypothetical protein
LASNTGKKLSNCGYNFQDIWDTIKSPDLYVLGPGIVVHTCNPRYLGNRNRWIMVQDQSGGKVSENLPQKISWLWWHMSVIPATREAEVGG